MTDYIEKLQTYFQLDLANHLRQEDDGRQAACRLIENKLSLPAYAAFLKEQGHEVKDLSAEQIATLPLTNKKNYVNKFSLAERCSDLDQMEMYAVSSGSTGEPTLWPRKAEHEVSMAERFEQVLCGSFQLDQGIRSLAVICFALGSWVGGMYTSQCCRIVSQKGYPLATVTPGNNKEEILRLVEKLAPQYEQIILFGYPPFIKDVLESGRDKNLDWARFQTKAVFAGEVFSEEWRQLIANLMGCQEITLSSASLYGTADGAVLGNETPLSISIRQYLSQQPDIAHELFGEYRLPTLVQYDPRQRYFEVVDNTLVVTGDNGSPLLRYHIADKGGLIPFKEMLQFMQSKGFDALKQLGEQTWTVPLPFVFLFGRADFTVSMYGANIFPENISVALEQDKIHPFVSGKFVMQIKQDEAQNPYLFVVVETKAEVSAPQDLIAIIQDSIQQQLIRLNSEFAHYVPKERQIPIVEIRAFADQEYFTPGIKHRYTRTSDQ